ncbi:unnamed protein product [Brassica oleracea var. botrytis]
MFWLVVFLTAGASVLLLTIHSQAKEIAVESVSAGEAENPSKTTLFLAFHSDHIIQRASGPAEIPDGGKHLRLQSECQSGIKSIVPLISLSVTNGASDHTCWVNGHWKIR